MGYASGARGYQSGFASLTVTTLSVSGTSTFTGVLTVPDGSESAPGIRSTSAANTGLYFTSNTVAATTGGLLQAYVQTGSGLVATAGLSVINGTDLNMSTGGQIFIDAGSATDCGLAFIGDSNTGLYRISADLWALAGGGAASIYGSGSQVVSNLNHRFESYLELPQIAEPAAPSAGITRIYAVDNGASKTQARARFDSGAAQAVATEP